MNKSNKAFSAVKKSKLRLALVGVLLGAVALGACAPRIDTRGNQLHLEDIATIQPGESTRGQVLDRLGSPSSQGKFGLETWYYISERTETTAFLAPEVKERQVVVIQFDEAGIVTTVDTVDGVTDEIVEPAPGETPTAGNSLNFFEQILSNLGRFNK